MKANQQQQNTKINQPKPPMWQKNTTTPILYNKREMYKLTIPPLRSPATQEYAN